MRRRYDHIDLRVRSLAEARPFYETVLPALGFTRDVRIEGWLQFEAAGADDASEFLVSQSRHGMSPTNAESPSWRQSEEVNRICAEQKRGQQSLRSSNISALIHRIGSIDALERWLLRHNQVISRAGSLYRPD